MFCLKGPLFFIVIYKLFSHALTKKKQYTENTNKPKNREKSLVKVAVHRAKVAHAMEQSRKRAEHGFQMWKTEQKLVNAMKMDVINRLNEDAQNWLTPETLDDEIERVLDQWLIASTLRTDIGRIVSE